MDIIYDSKPVILLKLQSKIEQIQSRIDYCEDNIDRPVYELYGLTEEEIRIVERKS